MVALQRAAIDRVSTLPYQELVTIAFNPDSINVNGSALAFAAVVSDNKYTVSIYQVRANASDAFLEPITTVAASEDPYGPTGVSFSPTNVTVSQEAVDANRGQITHTTRSRRLPTVKYFDTLRWTPPLFGGGNISAYRIFEKRNNRQKRLLGVVSSDGPLEFKKRNHESHKKIEYSIKAVDSFGQKSPSVRVKL